MQDSDKNKVLNNYVIARDRDKGYVLLWGLGPIRVGEIWLKDDGSWKERPEYENAPERVKND